MSDTMAVGLPRCTTLTNVKAFRPDTILLAVSDASPCDLIESKHAEDMDDMSRLRRSSKATNRGLIASGASICGVR